MTNLLAPQKPIGEREAHERVAPAYGWWIDLHRDNPSAQTVWETKFFDKLWKLHDGSKYTDPTVLEQIRQWEEHGYTAMLAMEHFCRDRVEELLNRLGLKADRQARPKIEKAFGAALQRASLDLAKLAKGEFPRPPILDPPAN